MAMWNNQMVDGLLIFPHNATSKARRSRPYPLAAASFHPQWRSDARRRHRHRVSLVATGFPSSDETITVQRIVELHHAGLAHQRMANGKEGLASWVCCWMCISVVGSFLVMEYFSILLGCCEMSMFCNTLLGCYMSQNQPQHSNVTHPTGA